MSVLRTTSLCSFGLCLSFGRRACGSFGLCPSFGRRACARLARSASRIRGDSTGVGRGRMS